MIKIIVDAYGGDNSPLVNVKGCVKCLNNLNDVEIILVGKENELTALLSDYEYDKSRLSILNADEIITCDDKPTDAIKHKKNSSLVKAFELLRESDDINAMVSVGSTGAILAGAVLRVGRIKGVKRPGFCPILPTMNHKIVGVCDSGANVDCDAHQLQQFAIMGSAYLEAAYNIKSPRVALLNVGTESEKGDLLRKETYELLLKTPSINFVGNMESRDLLNGKYHLIVCDGFSGNVLIKSTEGACLEMLKLLKHTFTKGFKNKLGALLLKKDIYEIKDFMDYNNYGGAVLLGTTKTIVKGHGSSKEEAIYQCLVQAYNMEKNNLRDKIAEEVTK